MTSVIMETMDNVSTDDGYYTETKANGNKLFICKQCEKEIKSEQGVKSHIANKHKKKRVRLETSAAETSIVLEEKKPRYETAPEEENIEFEFDPLSVHTSSQLLADSPLDETAKIVQEYMGSVP